MWVAEVSSVDQTDDEVIQTTLHERKQSPPADCPSEPQWYFNPVVIRKRILQQRRDMPNYWLFKSEPDVFSIQDLAAQPGRRTTWEGVRNYQARNFLRDDVRKGDGVLFYHSRSEPMCIAGTAEVVKAGYPDHFAWEAGHPYFDEASTESSPVWYMVDIRLQKSFAKPVTRRDLENHPNTQGMMVLRKGSRLSIQPVTEAEWTAVLDIAAALENSHNKH